MINVETQARSGTRRPRANCCCRAATRATRHLVPARCSVRSAARSTSAGSRRRGSGTIYSFTVNRRGQGDYRDLAYVLAYVELEEGPRMLTNIVDCDPETVSVGQAVEVVFHRRRPKPRSRASSRHNAAFAFVVDRLNGKVAIVTGGASGIGRASAKLMAAEGASVCVGDVDETGGRRTVADIEGEGGAALFIRTDVSVAADCERLVEAAVERFGALTCCTTTPIGPAHGAPFWSSTKRTGIAPWPSPSKACS